MYNNPLNRPMFQKKVPGYRNGGGIAYLANGGRPNIPVSGERIRIKPSTVKPPSGPSIPTNRSLIVNPVDETLKKLDRQRFGDQFKGLNFKDKFSFNIFTQVVMLNYLENKTLNNRDIDIEKIDKKKFPKKSFLSILVNLKRIEKQVK